MMRAEWAKLQAFHMRDQRRILGIKWKDFIRNDVIMQTTELNTTYTTGGCKSFSLARPVPMFLSITLLYYSLWNKNKDR